MQKRILTTLICLRFLFSSHRLSALLFKGIQSIKIQFLSPAAALSALLIFLSLRLSAAFSETLRLKKCAVSIALYFMPLGGGEQVSELEFLLVITKVTHLH